MTKFGCNIEWDAERDRFDNPVHLLYFSAADGTKLRLRMVEFPVKSPRRKKYYIYRRGTDNTRQRLLVATWYSADEVQSTLQVGRLKFHEGDGDPLNTDGADGLPTEGVAYAARLHAGSGTENVLCWLLLQPWSDALWEAMPERKETALQS